MFARKSLNELAERRRLLVLESDLHRNLIALDFRNLRSRVAGLQAARERVKAGGPWLAAGGAVAGVLALRHWRKLARWVPTALTAVRWVKSLTSR